MATDEKANLRHTGPIASHDIECSIRGCAYPAVLDINTGVYQPCWSHQSQGWATVKKRFWSWRSLKSRLPFAAATIKAAPLSREKS